MGKRVLLATRDLFFRSKLDALVAAAGAEVVRDEAECDLAVVELGGEGVEARGGRATTVPTIVCKSDNAGPRFWLALCHSDRRRKYLFSLQLGSPGSEAVPGARGAVSAVMGGAP